MNKKNQKQIFLKLRPIKLKQSQSISKVQSNSDRASDKECAEAQESDKIDQTLIYFKEEVKKVSNIFSMIPNE